MLLNNCCAFFLKSTKPVGFDGAFAALLSTVLISVRAGLKFDSALIFPPASSLGCDSLYLYRPRRGTIPALDANSRRRARQRRTQSDA